MYIFFNQSQKMNIIKLYLLQELIHLLFQCPATQIYTQCVINKLRMNMLANHYFSDAFAKKTFKSVLLEIYVWPIQIKTVCSSPPPPPTSHYYNFSSNQILPGYLAHLKKRWRYNFVWRTKATKLLCTLLKFAMQIMWKLN